MAKASKTNKALAARKARREAAVARPADVDNGPPMSPPYGYSEADGVAVPDEAETEIIVKIREFGEKKMQAKVIAERLNKLGLQCRGNAWDVRDVTRILRRKVTKVKGR